MREDGSGKDTITGGSGADLIFAQSNNDTLTGGGGNDLLCGDSGSDTLSGGGGDDSLGGGAGGDRLTGGSGADRFSGGSGVDAATDVTAAEGDTTDGTIPRHERGNGPRQRLNRLTSPDPPPTGQRTGRVSSLMPAEGGPGWHDAVGRQMSRWAIGGGR